MITPSTPCSGTSSRAVTARDLFLTLSSDASVRRPILPKSSWELLRRQLRPPGKIGVEALFDAVVEWEHVVLPRS